MITINIKEPELLEVGRLASQEGVEALVVGGYVRDYFLERGNKKDYDITVVGDPIEFAKKVADYYGVKPVIFKRFRTAHIPLDNGIELEFVGTRKESYKPGSRHPITEEGSLYDDIKRRDFTVNSIAAYLNPESLGKVVDPFDGIKDIQNKVLRTPLEPEVTFQDDPLRMLRAVRFYSQLGFKILDEEQKYIKKLAKNLEFISQERITSELFKILASDSPGYGILKLQDLGLLKYVFKPLSDMDYRRDEVRDGKVYRHKNNFTHTWKVVQQASLLNKDPWFRFVAMVHDIAKPKTQKFIQGKGWSFHGHEELGANIVPQIFKDLKLPNDKVDYVQTIVRLHGRPKQLREGQVTDSALRRLILDAGEYLEDLITFCIADITTNDESKEQRQVAFFQKMFDRVKELEEKDELRNWKNPITGDFIMQVTGLNPGKEIGVIKDKVKDGIIDGKVENSYESAEYYFLENWKNWIYQEV